MFARREPGESIRPSEWDRRDLPAPSVRSVLFGARCVAEATRLGPTDPGRLNVLGDGAGWIWKPAVRRFPGASQCLDFRHGSGHLGDGAVAVFGSGAEAEAALDRGQERLLEDGYRGVAEWFGELAVKMPAGGDGAASGTVLDTVLDDFAGHQARSNDVLRLRRGQSIGSGLVEGSIEQMLNVRLKQTGARRNVDHVAPPVELGPLPAGPEWVAFWKQR